MHEIPDIAWQAPLRGRNLRAARLGAELDGHRQQLLVFLRHLG